MHEAFLLTEQQISLIIILANKLLSQSEVIMEILLKMFFIVWMTSAPIIWCMSFFPFADDIRKNKIENPASENADILGKAMFISIVVYALLGPLSIVPHRKLWLKKIFGGL